MKQNDSYQDFDKQVRQLLSQASEPVPEGAWEAIAARLAAGYGAGTEAGKAAATAGATASAGIARKAIVLKWVRRTGFSVAAAAAVLLAVLLWNRDEQPQDNHLAVVTETEQDAIHEPSTINEPNVVTEPGATATSQPQLIASAEPANTQAPALVAKPSSASAKPSSASAEPSSASAESSSVSPGQSAVVPSETGPGRISPDGSASSTLVAQSIIASSTEVQAEAETPTAEATTNPQPSEVQAEAQTAEAKAQPIDWDNLPELEDDQQAKSHKKHQPNGFHLAAYTNALSNFTSKKSGQYTGYSGVSGDKRPDHSYFDDENRESNYSIPLTFGLNVTYDILPRFSMGVGINYTRLSRHFAATYFQMDKEGKFDAGTDYDNVYNIQQFIGIPITAYFHIVRTKRINFYVYANGTVEKCLANTWTANNRTVNYNEPVKGVQFNAGAGLGVDFMLAPVVSIYLDPNVKYYFGLNQPKSIRTKQPFMLGFEAGVRFHL